MLLSIAITGDFYDVTHHKFPSKGYQIEGQATMKSGRRTIGEETVETRNVSTQRRPWPSGIFSIVLNRLEI